MRKVLLIDHNGEKIGDVSRERALSMAREVELDLVEVSPNAKPPVCKIMDYGKFRYERTKKEHLAQKKQHQVKVKEIRISAKIGEHDLGVKIRNAREMLIGGDRVDFILRFEGREITHSNLGKQLMNRVKENLSDVSIVESDLQSMGRIIKLSLAPDKIAVDKIKQKRKKEQSEKMSSRKSKRAKRAEKESKRMKNQSESLTPDADKGQEQPESEKKEESKEEE